MSALDAALDKSRTLELARARLPLLKAEHVYSAAEFRAAASRYRPVGRWPLVQQYAPGRGLGQFFFMHEGRAVRRFQHARVAEWPPEGGFSAVCESVPLRRFPELQEKSIALLRALEWQGAAMVEYRHDPATGRSMLMEVNGRFWGSFPLAVHAGAGFALLAYFLQGLGRMPPLAPVREDVRADDDDRAQAPRADPAAPRADPRSDVRGGPPARAGPLPPRLLPAQRPLLRLVGP